MISYARKQRNKAHRSQWLLGRTLVALALGAALASPNANAQTSDVAPALKIAVFTGERPDSCHDNGYADAIRRLTQREADRVNRSGMLGVRPLQLVFHTGDQDVETATAGLREALAEPTLLGIVGMRRSSVAEQTFAEMGDAIAQSGVPFASGFSVTSLFQPYKNVFSMRVSQEDEQIPAIRSFLRDAGYERPGFVGRKGVIYSEALGDGLARIRSGTVGPPIIVDRRLELPSRGDATPAQVTETVAALKEANADVVFLHIGSRRSPPFLKEMIRVGYTPAVFLTGRIETLFGPGKLQDYPAAIHQLAWGGLPHIQSDRLRRLIDAPEGERRIFGGKRNKAAPGWEDGSCEDDQARLWSSVYAPGNIRATTRGAEYADMVGLIAEAAATAPRDAPVEFLRAHVIDQIGTRYAAGRGAYVGMSANWSFRPETRTTTRTPTIVERPADGGVLRLAPTQYVRLRGDALQKVRTYFMDIDLNRIFRVNDGEGTFFADFYLSLFDEEGGAIDRIEFGNAFLDPNTNRRMVEIVELHDGGESAAYPENIRLYRVSGRFMFSPSFEVYPLDRQRFSIDIQPRRSDDAMILQPPAPSLRDREAKAEGWLIREQYVSFDEDFTPLVDARNGEQTIAPFYKASFVWVMDRQATDYYLRVAIPLMVILAIAYFSIFISKESFEAIVTIQVTALLSAVALYLAVPKVDSATATLSDKIFLVDYVAVFLMIATTILRANRVIKKIPLLPQLLGIVHVIAVPVLVGMMGYYVYDLNRQKAEDGGGLEETMMEEGAGNVEARFPSR